MVQQQSEDFTYLLPIIITNQKFHEVLINCFPNYLINIFNDYKNHFILVNNFNHY